MTAVHVVPDPVSSARGMEVLGGRGFACHGSRSFPSVALEISTEYLCLCFNAAGSLMYDFMHPCDRYSMCCRAQEGRQQDPAKMMTDFGGRWMRREVK